MRTSVLKQSQQPGGAVISLSPLGSVFSLSRCVELKPNLCEVFSFTFTEKVPSRNFSWLKDLKLEHNACLALCLNSVFNVKVLVE